MEMEVKILNDVNSRTAYITIEAALPVELTKQLTKTGHRQVPWGMKREVSVCSLRESQNAMFCEILSSAER
jgi:protein-L-isoaspartate O-methyltransferase